MGALSVASYRQQLAALLPRGLAWARQAGTVLGDFMGALAEELARIDAAGWSAIDEADPRTALALLPDWERVCGLPDVCGGSLAGTLQERRAAVVDKLTAEGGCSQAYFESLALAMGYTVQIDVFRPFVAGVNRCGDKLGGGHAVRYNWRVRVTGPRYTPFRAGASQCGDKLGEIDRASDLECKFNRLKPAHTRLIFSYTGV